MALIDPSPANSTTAPKSPPLVTSLLRRGGARRSRCSPSKDVVSGRSLTPPAPRHTSSTPPTVGSVLRRTASAGAATGSAGGGGGDVKSPHQRPLLSSFRHRNRDGSRNMASECGEGKRILLPPSSPSTKRTFPAATTGGGGADNLSSSSSSTATLTECGATQRIDLRLHGEESTGAPSSWVEQLMNPSSETEDDTGNDVIVCKGGNYRFLYLSPVILSYAVLLIVRW